MMNENFDKNQQNENLTQENSLVTDTEKETEIETEIEKQGGKRLVHTVFEWLETLAFAFIFVLVIFTFALKIVTVDGNSMNRTLENGERLIISNLFYEPKTGDIVIISRERIDKEPIVKRVIATEGQKVEIDYESWQVTVDGVLLDEPYVYYKPDELMRRDRCPESFTVDKNMVFVMGDNRNNSSDSRTQGEYHYVNGECFYVGYTEDDIIGKVLFRIIPLHKFGAIKPADPEPIITQE
ncbi:MAG: signal peptidase I [Ruminococcaceae bacterium]|nr:signal peptidase I [Oscillospiraceae bacterium]